MWRVFNHDAAAFRQTLDLERGMRPGIRQYHRGDSASRHEPVVSLPHGAMVIMPEEGTRPIIVGRLGWLSLEGPIILALLNLHLSSLLFPKTIII